MAFAQVAAARFPIAQVTGAKPLQVHLAVTALGDAIREIADVVHLRSDVVRESLSIGLAGYAAGRC